MDAGETGETDGSGRKAIIIKSGAPGTSSGGIIITSNKIKHSNNTPMDETDALVDCLGRISLSRTLSEEMAGLRNNKYITDEIVTGSPEPTSIYVGEDMAGSMNSTDTGDTDCVVRTQTMRRLQNRIVNFPSMVYEDNEMVTRIANADGKIKLSGLRSAVRKFGAIHRGIEDGVIDVVQLPSQENLSNHMSKLPSSPLSHVLGMEGMVGRSPEMDMFKAAAISKFGKKPNPNSNTDHHILPITESLRTEMALAAIPTWTESVSKGVSNIIQKKGFLEAHIQPSIITKPDLLPDSKEKYGIGYIIALSAIAAKQNYSVEYAKYSLPNPLSTITEEVDRWDLLVQANSIQNGNPTETEFYERTIAAKGTMTLQMPTIGSQQELEDLERLQQRLKGELQVSAARKVAMMSINNNKRSIDNSNRDSGIIRNERRLLEERHNRVQFAAIGSSEEYIDFNTEGVKKQRSIAPVNTVSKERPLPDTHSANERITYDQLVVESQLGESDSIETDNHSRVLNVNSSLPPKKKNGKKQGIECAARRRLAKKKKREEK